MGSTAVVSGSLGALVRLYSLAGVLVQIAVLGELLAIVMGRLAGSVEIVVEHHLCLLAACLLRR